MEKFCNSNCEFAVQFFKQVAKDGQNSLLSPASITAALAMTYAGADRETKSQMNSVLFNGLNDEEINAGLQQMIKTTNTPVDGYTLKMANRLYVEKSCQVLQSFLDAVQKYHLSDCISCDFVKESAKTAKDINSWVEQSTNGKIKDLVKPDLLTPLTRLVMANAIYFKGDWKKEFDVNCTTKQPFHITANQQKDVNMMHMKMKDFLFAQNDKCEVLGIEYKSPNVAMFFVLPKKRNGLHELEHSLNGSELTMLIQQAIRAEVVVDLPKFNLESEHELSDSFKKLGCTDMFSNGADFSKISDTKDLKVSAIVHKAFVEVNEKGAEAASATIVVMNFFRAATKEVLRFKANHPFLFAIVDRKAMIILFLGHYYG